MFKRIANLIRGFLGLSVSGLEMANPEALLEVEAENLRRQIGEYNKGLVAHAQMCERLISQVKRLEDEERQFRAQAGAQLRAGNRESAGQFALRLQTTQRELSENRQQLQDAEKTYKELIRAREVSVEAAKKKIADLKFALGDLKVKKATAELAEMASGMISTIGGSGDTLDRLHNMVEEERQKAAGKARVAKDSIDMSGLQFKESEQKALEDQALADFAAAEGIALEAKPSTGSTSDAGPSKSMGPIAE